jgi:hypothetical protein
MQVILDTISFHSVHAQQTRRLCRLLANEGVKYHMERRVYLVSNRYRALREAAKRKPHVHAGALK